MPDDPQGFDWSALLQSATPFAAALIPAAVGAVAGGRGAAGIGAATGFSEGMRGQVGAEQEYQKQRAQVQEANQRAAIAQQEQELRTAEFKQRQAYQAITAQHIESQMQEAEVRKQQIQKKMDYYDLTDKNQQQWANENLTGAKKATFLAGDRKDRSAVIKETYQEQDKEGARQGLLRDAQRLNVPPSLAQNLDFKDLSKLVTTGYEHLFQKQLEVSNRQGSYSDVPGVQDADGNPLQVRFNHHTGQYEGFTPMPAGTTKPGKPLTDPQQQSLITKRFLADTGIKPTATGGLPSDYADKRTAWEISPYGQAAINIQDEKKYQAEIGKLKKADTTGMANAKKAYLAQSYDPKTQAKPTAEGWEAFKLKPEGQEFIQAHKELARSGPAPEPETHRVNEKPAAKATTPKIIRYDAQGNRVQ